MKLFAATAAFCLAAAPALASVVFESTMTNAEGETVSSSETTVQDGKVLMKSQGDPKYGLPGSTTIFRGNAQEMVMVDHQNQTYSVMTADQMRATMSGVQAQMREALQGVPEEQRAAMEKSMAAMMGGGAESSVTVNATGESKTINGDRAREYEVMRDGALTHRVWAVEPGDLTGGGELAVLYNDMAAFYEGMPMTKKVEWMFDLDGSFDGRMPVLMEEYGASGALETRTEIASREAADLPASAFEPPADYTRQDMMGGR